MVRFAATALALTILPGFAAAQQPVQTASRTHVVVKGETLWALAGRYYEDPFQWPRIFEANRTQIEDPDLIEPDQRFVIPGVAAEEAEMAQDEPAVVGEVAVSVAPQTPAAPPAEAQISERDRKSVFFRGQESSSGSVGFDEQEFLWVSRASVWSAEWLGPENVEAVRSDGRISSLIAQGDLRMALAYARVRIALNPGVQVAVGDALQAFRADQIIEGVGSIVRPTGVLSVTKVDPRGVEAVVLQPFERVQPGDLIRPAPTFDLVAGQYPEVVTDRSRTTVLTFGASHALYGVGDVAILNTGGQQGVAIGDEYVVYEREGVTDEVVGRLRVVATNDRTASARIMSANGAVFRTGIAVHLDRKMR